MAASPDKRDGRKHKKNCVEGAAVVGEAPTELWQTKESVSIGGKLVARDVQYRKLASGLVQRRWIEPYNLKDEYTPWQNYEQGSKVK